MTHRTRPNALRLALLVALLALVGCRKDPPPPPAVPLVGEPTEGGAAATPATALSVQPTSGASAGSGDLPMPTDPAPADNVFVWPEVGAEYLDPNKISESAGAVIGMNLFEGLLAYAPGNGPSLPGVAERWESRDDARVWTFHLRADARWSNGRVVTAGDFAYSWQRCLEPATASRNAQQLWFIKGAKEFNTGALRDFAQVGVKVIDDRTLEVDLVGPTPFFPSVVPYIAYAPVPREAIEAHGDGWTKPENIVTNGAFHLTENKLRDRLVMKKSPTYWDAKSVRLDGAVVLHSESETNAWQLYEQGKVHWTPGTVPSDKIPLLLAAGRKDFHVDPYMCIYYYVFRTDRPPFDNAELRRAINRATDKERITKHITRGGQIPATHLVPPMFKETTGYTSPEGEAFDPEEAARLLAEAGYPGGKGLPPVELVYNTLEGNRLIAESIQRNLKDVLGIEATLSNMEWKSLLQKLNDGEFQLGRGSWCADYPDPQNFLEVFHSQGESNYSAYKNPEYDALLDRIRQTGDPQKRNELMAQAEAMLSRDLPMLPMYFYTRSYLLKPWVRGFEPQYRDNHLLKYIWFEK